VKTTVKQEIERRFVPATEMRIAKEADVRKLVGHASVFNSASQDLGGFTEIIAPGAFKEAIPRSDIRSLFNHNPDYVLGRMKAGTLSVSEDKIGLYSETTPPDTNFARDLLVSIDRGDIDQMSFAFSVAKNGDEWVFTDETCTRTIFKFEQLYDVSPVTYPAYTDTSVAVRSRESWSKDHNVIVVPKTVQRDLRRRRLRLSQGL
jgi:HK97 family phage prohead protease